jgi:hypothetical protein
MKCLSKNQDIFFLGFFSVVAQSLVFREFIGAFDSGAVPVALFFFSWLFWVSISSLAMLWMPPLRVFFAKTAPHSFLLYIFALGLQFALFVALCEKKYRNLRTAQNGIA